MNQITDDDFDWFAQTNIDSALELLPEGDLTNEPGKALVQFMPKIGPLALPVQTPVEFPAPLPPEFEVPMGSYVKVGIGSLFGTLLIAWLEKKGRDEAQYETSLLSDQLANGKRQNDFLIAAVYATAAQMSPVGGSVGTGTSLKKKTKGSSGGTRLWAFSRAK